MSILLISLQKDLDIIGLKYLHYYLLDNSHASLFLCLPNLNPNDIFALEQIRKFVLNHSPNLIGVSLMSVEYDKACGLTTYLKRNFPTIPVIWGGIHPTIAPEMCLDYADYVCIGEGEKTILDAARAAHNNQSLTGINNLCYRADDGQVKKNPLYPRIENLDEIPFYDHIPIHCFIQERQSIGPVSKKSYQKYARYSGTTYSVMSSRGCPFSCTYCCNNFISRLYGARKVTRRSIGNIIAELERAIRNNPEIEYINFQDDCFLACTSEYLKEFCELYQQKINRPFIVRSIPTYITRDKMESLKKAGLAWISLGLQSGSDRVCREIYRRKSLKADFLKAAGIIKDFRVAAFYDVILDNPFETEEDQLETIQTLSETPKPFYTQFFSLSLYLGTELHTRAQQDSQSMKGYLSMESSLSKDYLIYNKSTINDMLRISTFLDKKHMQRVVDLYKEKPESFKFKVSFLMARLLSMIILEPLTYFRVIKLSQNDRYLRTFKVLPSYFKEGFKRYVNQFKGRLTQSGS
ncbi:MAG: radical SAM protein [bacterium]